MSVHAIEVPERFDGGSLARFAEALEVAERDDTARVWVLRGTGEAFCRGMDLRAAIDAEDVAEGARRYAMVLSALRNASRPTIAVVEGEALGGGVGIAAACDRVMATPSAVFGLPESLFGLVPAMVIPVLLERMTPQMVRLLALSGTTRTASWAHEAGLVDDVVDVRDLPLLLRARTRELGRAHPASVAALRVWIPRAMVLPTDEAIVEGAALLADRVHDPRTRAALSAFIEEGAMPWSS